MKKIAGGILALLFSLFAAAPISAQLKRIRFSASSIAVTELQFKIAQLKGFYRDEGLDLETILIRGAVGLQALLGGSVDYSSAAGALIAAAVRGVPVKLVLIVNSKPQFDLVGAPEIKTMPQYYMQNRADSIEMLSRHLGIKDPSLAGEAYDLHISRLGAIGTLDDAWMRGAIDFTKKSLTVTKDIPPKQVFDFSFVEKALAKSKN